MSVDRISIVYNQGYTPQEIADDYSLTLAQVFAALAYYLANRDEVERGIDDLDAEGERLYAEYHAHQRGLKQCPSRCIWTMTQDRGVCSKPRKTLLATLCGPKTWE